jgi:hypothetical protein
MLHKLAIKRTVALLVSSVFILSALSFSANSQVSNMKLQQYFEAPKLVGEARLKFVFWDVYDATLIAPQGNFSPETPFALQLKYLRDFAGEDIASRSIDEMRKLGMNDELKLAKWYQEMQSLFPNVKKGEVITGIVDAENKSYFYFNEKLLGDVEDKEFSKWFFNIWLSEDTSEPKMRKQLLGLTK